MKQILFLLIGVLSTALMVLAKDKKIWIPSFIVYWGLILIKLFGFFERSWK